MLSQMSIAKPSMTIVELNNVVVTLRTKVKKARAQVIQRLVKQIKTYRTKKGSEAQTAENNKRADKLHEEIILLKKANVDHIAKHCLANKSTVKQASSQAGGESMANLHIKSYTRIACHKLMTDAVAKWREGRDDWEELAAFLQSKNTGRRYKKKKKKLDSEILMVATQNENEETEKTEKSVCGVKNCLGTALGNDDDDNSDDNESDYNNNDEGQISESGSEDDQDLTIHSSLNKSNPKKSASKPFNKDTYNISNDVKKFASKTLSLDNADDSNSDDEMDDSNDINASEDFDSENASYDDDSESENSANVSDNLSDLPVKEKISKHQKQSQTVKPSAAINAKQSRNVKTSAVLNVQQAPNVKNLPVLHMKEIKREVASDADEFLTKAGKSEAVIRRLNLESLGEGIEELPILKEKQESSKDLNLDESEPTTKKRKKDSFFLREGKDSDVTSSEDESSEENEESVENPESDGGNEINSKRINNNFHQKQGNNKNSDYKSFNKRNDTTKDFQNRQPKRAWERNQGPGKNFANRNKNMNNREHSDRRNKSDRGGNSRGHNVKNFGCRNTLSGRDVKNFGGKNKHSEGLKNHHPPMKVDIKSSESDKPIHPSWEASRKRKEQQTKIVAFAGKKIKFDDD